MMDPERDVETVETERRVKLQRSLSMRQMLLLLFTVYFAGTGGLFWMVEKGVWDSAAAPVIESDDGSGSDDLIAANGNLSGTSNVSSEDVIIPVSDTWDIIEEQISMSVGDQVFVSSGQYPYLVWAGDRYGMLFFDDGLRVTYSHDGSNWTKSMLIVPNKEGPAQTGVLLRLDNGTYCLFFSKATNYDYSLYLTTSIDGLSWKEPVQIPTGNMQNYYIWGITAVEMDRDPENSEILLAFSTNWYLEAEDVGGGSDIMTMKSADGITWSAPEFARTPASHQFPENILYALGPIKLIQRNGRPVIVHVDGMAMVWAGPLQEEVGWNITQVSPDLLPSYSLGASITSMPDNSTVVVFDHMGEVYITRSMDLVNWEKPVNISKGYMPSITMAGRETLALAYCLDNKINFTLISSPVPQPVINNTPPEIQGPVPVMIEFVEGGSWTSDIDEPYIHGDQGMVCLLNKHAHLQILTSEGPRSVNITFPTHQGDDGWLWSQPTLDSGLYDFNELQLTVVGLPGVDIGQDWEKPGDMLTMPIGEKYHCRFRVSLYDPETEQKIGPLSHYDEDEWHWDEPIPDIYMVRESENQWRIINTGYINHYFTPQDDDPNQNKDHPVYLPFEIIITKISS